MRRRALAETCTWMLERASVPCANFDGATRDASSVCSPGPMTMSCIVLAETKNRISTSMRCVPMVMMMMSFNCSCMDSLCKVKGLRYLRLVESMRYSQRALFFALFLSFLQPAISQDLQPAISQANTCPTGTTGAPAPATLTCGSFGTAACPSDCVGSGATSGNITDLPGVYLNYVTCWWLLKTT